MATLKNTDVWLFSELTISMQEFYSKRFTRFITVRYSQRIEIDVNSSD